MPNWVVNRITLEGEGVEEILKQHFAKNEENEDYFDFNTIVKMPTELNIEKSTRTEEGIKLYLSKINPLIPNLGTREDKVSMYKFSNLAITTFGDDAMNNIPKYILKPQEIEDLKAKYKNDFEDTINLGRQAIDNINKYGYTDWYEWRLANWGCKWNSCNSFIAHDKKTICFDTAWVPSIQIINKLSRMHPELKITYDYAEEQTGFMSGHIEYENGEQIVKEEFKPYSKEAYEMSFELWGCEEDYYFDEDEDNYVYKEDEED